MDNNSVAGINMLPGRFVMGLVVSIDAVIDGAGLLRTGRSPLTHWITALYQLGLSALCWPSIHIL